MNKFFVGAAAGYMILSGVAAVAQTTTLSATDQQFLRRDARGSAYERALSELALQQAASPQVRQFAQRDVADHDTLTQQAQQIASHDGLTLTASPNAKQQRRIDHLRSLTGPAFDSAYVSDMRQINQNDKGEFATEAQSTQNRQVKEFVQQAVAMDQQHEAMVQNLQAAEANSGPSTTRQ